MPQSPEHAITGNAVPGFRSIPPAAWAFAGLLWLLWTVTAPFGGPYLDTIRDVYWASRIAHGAEWPLVGPEIGFFVHIGPAWFYLLAPVLLIFSSYTAVAIWAGMLAGLKFPLALLLGTRLADWRLGLAWAAVLALPGLAVFTTLSMTHFNLVETAVLAFGLAALALHRHGGFGWALLTGLLFGLMLHAHPTTIVYGWLLPWLVIARPGRRPRRAAGLLAGAVLPFLPRLAAGGDADAYSPGALAAHLRELLQPSAILDTPRLLWETVVVSIGDGLQLVTNQNPPLVILLGCGMSLLLVLAAAGAFAAVRHQQPHARFILGGVLGAVAFAVQVAVMRPATLWYMMLGILPLIGLAWAAGLAALPGPARGRLALPLACVTAVVTMALFLSTLIRTADDQSPRHFPTHRLMDLKHPRPPRDRAPVPLLSFVNADRLGRHLCALDGPLVAHGALALRIDSLAGTATALHCDPAPEVLVGGKSSAPHRHILGVGGVVAAAIGEPDRRLGPFRFYENVRPIHPPTPIHQARARDYPPRRRIPAGAESKIVRFELPPGRMLAVSQLFRWWSDTEVLGVWIDGIPARRLADDGVTTLYDCGHCADAGGPFEWHVEFRAPGELPVDIVALLPPDQALEERREDKQHDAGSHSGGKHVGKQHGHVGQGLGIEATGQ